MSRNNTLASPMRFFPSLAVMILMFVGTPVLAQDADTTAADIDTTMIEQTPEGVLDMDVLVDDTTSVEGESIDLMDAILDTTMQDDLATDMTVDAILDADSLAADTTIMEAMDADSLGMMSVDSLGIGADTLGVDVFTPAPSFQYTAPEEMVWIDAGALPDPLRHFRDDSVEIAWSNGFFIDEFEVTNEEFANFLSDDPENLMYFDERMYITQLTEYLYQADQGREDMPVTFVSWFGAFAYAQWKGKSLPTEEEWILACLGSYSDENLTKWYPWGQTKPDSIQANLLKPNTIGSPEIVGSYPGSLTSTGLYDMAGNVAEWTITNFAQRQPTNIVSAEDDSEYENPTIALTQVENDSTAADLLQTDADTEEQLDMSIRFVIKGGSYLDPPSNTQLNRRTTRFPHERYQYVGFRCVRREGTR